MTVANARASLVDVARTLGVAPSTVSRAFNHPQLLKPETVAAVHAEAERLGYVPNRHARALITGRTGAVGLIVPDITNPFFPKLARAAQRAGEQHGLAMFIAETNYDPEQERRQIATMAPQAEGVIVASSRLPHDELTLIAERTRLVLINTDAPGLSRVLISARDALRAGVDHLVAHGARRLCYVGGPARSWAESERRATVEAAVAAYRLPLVQLRDESGTYNEARALAERVVDAEADAVIAYDDVVAHGVLDGLYVRGVRVPQDVALLGCDDALPIQTHPRMSTIRFPSAEAVRAAMALVVADGDLVDKRIEVHGVLEMRETTP
ncbi:LacI family DNA-binding transcriptional regulator [Microbacterium murale]|nr:LacI family DNA-binding transcriptional regulator [Microbacterium murale]